MLSARGMWSWALMVPMFTVLIIFPGLSLAAKASEVRVAVVNGSVISKDDLDREMGRLKQKLIRMGKRVDDSQLSTFLRVLLAANCSSRKVREKGSKLKIRRY